MVRLLSACLRGLVGEVESATRELTSALTFNKNMLLGKGIVLWVRVINTVGCLVDKRCHNGGSVSGICRAVVY